MSMFTASPEELAIQAKKADRRREAAPALEGRRAKLSEDPQVQEILKDVRFVVDEMKFQHPEVMGIGLFGSLVKGYATPHSDIDGFLYIDVDQTALGTDSAQKPVSPAERAKTLSEEFVQRLRAKGRVIDHVFVGRLDKKFLDSQLSSLSKRSAEYLARFFMLSIGKEILPYREKILDRLSQLETGRQTEVFSAMMDELSRLENSGFPDEVVNERRKLYPKTVEEAHMSFLALQPSSKVPEKYSQPKAA